MDLVLCILGYFISTTFAINSQYENNIGSNERAFRSGKVLQLWEKAQRQNKLSSVMMTDLYGQLRQHDRQLMELKVFVSQGGDNSGIQQSKLEQELNDIMAKYGLIGGNVVLDETLNSKSGKNKDIFSDSKLNNLWERVTFSKEFTPQELEKLFIELKHHDDKLLRFIDLKEEISQDREISENSIDHLDKSEQIKNTERELNGLHDEILEDYQRLVLVSQKSKDGGFGFKEPRVLKLWREAEKGNFTVEELKSLKQELVHFEGHIEKHRHFREQLRNSDEKIEYHGGKDMAPDEHVTRHQKLHNKVKTLADQVEKRHYEMKKKIGRVIRHSEL